MQVCGRPARSSIPSQNNKYSRFLRVSHAAKFYPPPLPCVRTHSTTRRFLIRRKTLGTPSCTSSSSTSWPKAYGGEAQDDDDDTTAEPPKLGRLGSSGGSRSSGNRSSGNRGSSLYMSCLGSGRSSKVPLHHGCLVSRNSPAVGRGRSVSSPCLWASTRWAVFCLDTRDDEKRDKKTSLFRRAAVPSFFFLLFFLLWYLPVLRAPTISCLFFPLPCLSRLTRSTKLTLPGMEGACRALCPSPKQTSRPPRY